MPTVRLDDTLEMHYTDDNFTDPWRTPETVVLQHGHGKNLKLWYGWLPHLVGQFRVIRLDARGLGESSRPPEGYPWSLEGFAGDIKKFLDVMGLEKVHLIGETLGGTMCLRFASLYPERLKSVAVCGSPYWQPTDFIREQRDKVVTDGVGPWVEAGMARHLDPEHADPGHEKWYYEQMAATDKRVLIEILSYLIGQDWSHMLPEISAPALIMVSEEVHKRTPDRSEGMQKMIPNCKLKVFEGYTGYVQHAYPELCAAAWKEFAASLN